MAKQTAIRRIAGKDVEVVMCQLKGGFGCKHKSCNAEGPSAAQIQRQRYRDSSGRYSEVNRCERCNRNAGIDYYSEPRLTHEGIGICLCGRCAGICEKLTDEQLTADLKNWKGI